MFLMNRYIKVPLIMGLTFAVSQAAILAWLGGRTAEELLLRAVTDFVLFALLGLIITSIHSRIVKLKVRHESEQDFDIRQQRSLTLRLPYDKAFAVCGESVAAVRGRIKTANSSDGKIEARTGWTWKTFGCVITYVIKPAGERLTEVQVSSRPQVRTTLIDYGENLDNVERICAFLSGRDSKLDLNLLSARLDQLAEARGSQGAQYNSATIKPHDNV